MTRPGNPCWLLASILGAILAGKVPSKKLRMGLSGAMALLGANLFYRGFF